MFCSNVVNPLTIYAYWTHKDLTDSKSKGIINERINKVIMIYSEQKGKGALESNSEK
jgi:hypothetical protein